MKQYHTEIVIEAPVAVVWQHLTNFGAYPDWNPLVGRLEGPMQVGQPISTFIVPLNKTYRPKLLAYTPDQELTWLGSQGAEWLLAGRHYYRLEALGDRRTRLYHGEYFTGILSHFIQPALLQKMENAFLLHNDRLKQRIEHGIR